MRYLRSLKIYIKKPCVNFAHPSAENKTKQTPHPTPKKATYISRGSCYCGQWIPNFAALAKSLYVLLPDVTVELTFWPSDWQWLPLIS